MRSNRLNILRGILFLFVLSLVACGGGGGGGTLKTSTAHWTRQFGVAGKGTGGYGVVTDASGNIYVTGLTRGGLDGNTLTGTADAFLTKYDAAGTRLYTRQLGAAGVDTYGNAVATDASGNVYVAGETSGGLDGNILTGKVDFFLTKYDASGTKQFTRQLGVAGSWTRGYAVAVDSNANVYVGGCTFGGLDGNTLTGTVDYFLTKYSALGAKVYTKQSGVPGKTTEGNAVATDLNGNVYIAGETNGGFDGNTLTGVNDLFCTMYNATGIQVHTMQLGVAGKSTSGNAVATDATGNVYISGSTNGQLDGNSLMGTTDFFLVKYDPWANKLFTTQLGVAGHDTFGYAVATEGSASVYVCGVTLGGLDGKTLTGTEDFFLSKYTSSGTKVYTKQMGAAGKTTRGRAVATDASGNVYASGTTWGGLDGNTLAGASDYFLSKYDSAGN
jgi:hypothetical protein